MFRGERVVRRSAGAMTWSVAAMALLCLTGDAAAQQARGAHLPSPAELTRAQEQADAGALPPRRLVAAPHQPAKAAPEVSTSAQPVTPQAAPAAADAPRQPAEPAPERAPTSSERAHEDTMRLAEAGLDDEVSLDGMGALIERLGGLRVGPALDLSPYVRDARWEQAVALLTQEVEGRSEAQRCADAADLLDKLEVDEAKRARRSAESALAMRLLTGRARLCAGGALEAKGRADLEAISRAERGKPFGVLAAQALGRHGALKQPPSVQTSRSFSAQLKALDSLGSKPEGKGLALERLAHMREDARYAWHWYRVRLVEAGIFERHKQLDAAAQVWFSIHRRTRDWSNGDAIERDVRAFERRSGLTVITTTDLVDTMRELITKRHYKRAAAARREVEQALGLDAKKRRKERDGWRLVYNGLKAERERHRGDAARLFERAEPLLKAPELRVALYFGWARALRRLDRDLEAVTLYKKLADEHPTHPLADNARYQAGRLLQYSNKHAEARRQLELLVAMHPTSKFVDDALWRAAFSAYLMGDLKGVDAPLEHLIAHFGDRHDESGLTLGLKARYWMGVAALKRGEREIAAARLLDTLQRGPLTWYGRLADARLRELGVKPPAVRPASDLTASDLRDPARLHIPDDPRLRLAATLTRMRLWDEALDETRRWSNRSPKPPRVDLLLAGLYMAKDEPTRGHWFAKRFITERGPDATSLQAWGLAYPLHFMKHAHTYGAKYGVSPFLVQAIMRQESGFNPKIKSHAGAVGLMQLMPGTARYTARVFLDDDTLKTSTLTQPETSIQLGAMYIRVHTAYAKDRMPLALAGYNAGPNALKSWFARYGTRELDAFVESITYTEARGYVRKVMTNLFTYAALYGEGPLPGLKLKLPKQLGEWGEVPEVKALKARQRVAMVLGARMVAWVL